MKTNYGKIAYQKTEDILNQLNYIEESTKYLPFCYRNYDVNYISNMFEHRVNAKESSTVNLHLSFEYSVAPINNIGYKIYLNDKVILESKLNPNQVNFVASGSDKISIVFTGDSLGVGSSDTAEIMPQISVIKFEYLGLLKNTFTTEPVYFDDNMTYYASYNNGVYTRHTSLTNLLNDYKYETSSNDFYFVNSAINSTKKQAIYGLFYNESDSMLTLKYLYSNATYPLKSIKPDKAVFIPISSSLFRIFYLLNGKLYFFSCSKTGTSISSDTEVTYVKDLKILSMFPIRLVQNNTLNFFGIGVVTKGGVYVLNYNSDQKNYTSKKHVGEAEYASGFFDKNSVNVVLYNNGVATVKSFSDSTLTNLIEIKKYYDCIMLYNASGNLLCLNFNGFTNLSS